MKEFFARISSAIMMAVIISIIIALIIFAGLLVVILSAIAALGFGLFVIFVVLSDGTENTRKKLTDLEI